MLHLLFDWEYPHWLMMAGAIVVAAMEGHLTKEAASDSRRISIGNFSVFSNRGKCL